MAATEQQKADYLQALRQGTPCDYPWGTLTHLERLQVKAAEWPRISSYSEQLALAEDS